LLPTFGDKELASGDQLIITILIIQIVGMPGVFLFAFILKNWVINLASGSWLFYLIGLCEQLIMSIRFMISFALAL